VPAQPPDHTVELAKQLRADPKREATGSQRGYDWQRWLTVEKWLELQGEDDLWIEFGEDVTTVTQDGIETVQAKDRDGTVSLGVAQVRELLAIALERGPSVRTVLWTTSRLTLEQKKPFGEIPGITYWALVQEEKASLPPLRLFLVENLPKDAADKVKSMDDHALLAAVRNVQFVTDDLDIEGLRRRVLGKLESRLAALGIANPSLQRESYGAALFEYVCRKSAKERDNRRLDRIMLDEEVLVRFERIRLANLPSSVEQSARLVEHVGVEFDKLLARKSAEIGQSSNATVASALERDLRSKYAERMARSLFDEAQAVDELSLLGEEVLANEYNGVPIELRQEILLRASRSSSVRGKLEDARRFLKAAEAIDGKQSAKPARARLLAAEGDKDGALRELREERDSESYSTLLSILLREKGALDAIGHYNRTGRSDRLTASGFTTMVAALTEIGNRQAALKLLEDVPEDVLAGNPMIALRRGLLSFSSIFEIEAQVGVLAGIPMDARAQPNVSPEKRRKPLDSALEDFRRVKEAAHKLGLPRAALIAASYETWSELLHPDKSASATERLRKDIGNLTAQGLMSVQFALAFDPEFEPVALRNQLLRRAALGGLNEDEFRALVAISLHIDPPADMATFVAQHRERLNREYGEPGTLHIEIQAIARSGDARRARELLRENEVRLSSDAKPFLEAVVSAAEGKDPVEAYTKAYEDKPTNDALRTLLRVLHDAGRWEAFAPRAEELFSRTGVLEELADAARAYIRLHDDENFLRLLAEHEELLAADPAIRRQIGWAHLRLGHLNEAKKSVAERAGADRDLDLELAVALESGDWESIPGIISVYLDPSNTHPAEHLIRAARLAQVVGSGPLLGLVDRAVELAPDDPQVLFAAYTLVLEEGLEEERPQSAEWFRAALLKSGEDGPVRQVDFRELLEHTRKSAESGQRISEAVMEGTLPMLAAARGLGGTQLQVTLGNLVGNFHQSDARKKIPVNLFSGRRAPAALKAKVLGLDISALMTLGWLGLLKGLSETYAELHIPAGVMMELFDGQRRIRERQKSRLRHAKEIDSAVKAGRLRVVKTSYRADVLDEEVGGELADLLRNAQLEKGVVVRPSPIHRIGDFEENADVSQFAAQLTDIPSLIDVLVANSRLDQEQERCALDQSRLRHDTWPTPAPVASDVPLYLDSLATEYLQQARVLEPVIGAFPNVFISERAALEANQTVKLETVTEEMLAIVASLRAFVAHGLRAGNVKSGKYQEAWSLGAPGERPSALNLIADLGNVEAVIFDDRAINKDGFVADNRGRRVPLGTTLDVIEDLIKLGTINKSRKAQLRMKLRRGGAMLIPLEVEELVDAARRSQAAASPEFKAIQQSIDFVRLVEAPLFPTDIPWFAGSANAIRNAVHAVWSEKRDIERCETLSNLLLGLHMAPEDWEFAWKGTQPPQWADSVAGALLAGLAFPITITDKEAKSAFDAWIERTVLMPLAENQAARYDGLVKYLIGLIGSGVAGRE